jgi:REP element-mobilizing transposase RayT
MILNDAGKMVEKWYLELTNKFSDIESGEYVVMPNHFHAIIINTGIFVGAHLCVRPNIHVHSQNNVSILGEPEPILDEPELILGEPEPILGEHEPILGEHIGSPLRAVTQWFKTMSTNEYIRGVKTLGWQPFNKKLWQRNYYEHIIRNERAHQNISNYIIHNPEKWQNDMFHSG